MEQGSQRGVPLSLNRTFHVRSAVANFAIRALSHRILVVDTVDKCSLLSQCDDMQKKVDSETARDADMPARAGDIEESEILVTKDFRWNLAQSDEV